MVFSKLQRLSIKHRLILVILIVASVVSVAEVILLTIYYRNVLIHNMTMRIRLIADVLGSNAVPALKFQDRQDALEVLSSLRGVGPIKTAYIFDGKGRLLAEYLRPGETLSVPLTVKTTDIQTLAEEYYEVWHAIKVGDERIGSLYLNSDLSDLHQAFREGLVLGGIIWFALFGLSFLLALWLQRTFSKPIEALAMTMKHVTAQGDYSVRAVKVSNDEFGFLVESFNHMLTEIQARGREVKKQVQLLERTNKELDQFVYVASHDLKAPLRAVENLARMIEKAIRDVLPPDKRELIELMQSRVRRMELLLDNLLQYSRIGRVPVPFEEVECSALVKDIVDLLGPPETFTVSVPEDLPKIKTQKTPLEQVFRNLIGNAIKHHNRGDGRIEVGWQDTGEFIEFRICDDGPGIAPQFHERIFLMFQTLKPRDEVEGSGMGLALVKKIVNEQGGRIWIQSDEGKQTCFFFTWPKQRRDEHE